MPCRRPRSLADRSEYHHVRRVVGTAVGRPRERVLGRPEVPLQRIDRGEVQPDVTSPLMTHRYENHPNDYTDANQAKRAGSRDTASRLNLRWGRQSSDLFTYRHVSSTVTLRDATPTENVHIMGYNNGSRLQLRPPGSGRGRPGAMDDRFGYKDETALPLHLRR
jgi:hypothetical protein